MDELILKKGTILKEVERRAAESDIQQKDMVDYSQEIMACNHNMKHIIRGNRNEVGRLIFAFIFGMVGSGYAFTKFPKNASTFWALIISSPIFIIAGKIGYNFGTWKASSDADYKKNRMIYEESLAIDERFSELVKQYKKKELSI
jgi:hypothetical protein